MRREPNGGECELVEPPLPIGRFGPYPERLREQFEGVIWRFRAGSRWREAPGEFGAWSTVYDRFSRRRDASVFEALEDGMIAEATRRDQVDMSVVSVDSTVVRAHHEAADSPRFIPVLGKVKVKVRGSAGRPARRRRGGRPVAHDPDLYCECNTVERLINKLKAWRGPATRYDKTPESYPAGLHLRGSIIWIRSLRPIE